MFLRRSSIVCLTFRCVVNMITRSTQKLRRLVFCKGRGEPLQGYHYIFLVLVILGLMNIAFWTGFAIANLKNRFESLKNRNDQRNRQYIQRDEGRALNVQNRFFGKFSISRVKETSDDEDEDITRKRLVRAEKKISEHEKDRLKKLAEKVQSKIENEDLQNVETDEQIKAAELVRIEENLRRLDKSEPNTQNKAAINHRNSKIDEQEQHEESLRKYQNERNEEWKNQQNGNKNSKQIDEKQSDKNVGQFQHNQQARNENEIRMHQKQNHDVEQSHQHNENLDQNKIEYNKRNSENIKHGNQIETKRKVEEKHQNEGAPQNLAKEISPHIENAPQFILHTDEILTQMPLISMNDLEENRTAVTVVVFVLSSPHNKDRRQAIRDTWWTKCKQPQAACYFVTDGFIKESMHDRLIEELHRHNDMLFLPTDEGLNNGLRLFFLLQWAQSKYRPSFFLRIDDDYFLCIERLLDELLQRISKGVVWGYWHCKNATAVYVDESFMLLSFDIVEVVLSWDEEKLLCHPRGDQQLAIWLTEHSVKFFGFHDKRLAHYPSVSDFALLKNSTVKLCDVRLGIREIYPSEMQAFWSKGNDGKKPVTDMVPVYSNTCQHRPHFKWDSVEPNIRFKPELCVGNPRWTAK